MVHRLLMAFAFAIPVAGAAVAPPTLPEITVTAPKPPDPQQLAGESVPNFIMSHGKPTVLTGQLSQWVTEICPRTEGLTPAFNAFVSARIEAVAASVRLATVNRPIQAWYVTALRGAAGADEIDDIWGQLPAGRLGSRLTTGRSSLIVFVLRCRHQKADQLLRRVDFGLHCCPHALASSIA